MQEPPMWVFAMVAVICICATVEANSFVRLIDDLTQRTAPVNLPGIGYSEKPDIPEIPEAVLEMSKCSKILGLKDLKNATEDLKINQGTKMNIPYPCDGYLTAVKIDSFWSPFYQIDIKTDGACNDGHVTFNGADKMDHVTFKGANKLDELNLPTKVSEGSCFVINFNSAAAWKKSVMPPTDDVIEFEGNPSGRDILPGIQLHLKDEFSWEPQMWAPCKPLNETISWCDKGYRWAEFKCKHYPTKRDVDDNLCGNSKPYLVEKCDACPYEYTWEPESWSACKPVNETINSCDQGYRWTGFKCKHYPEKGAVDDSKCGISKPYLVEKCNACLSKENVKEEQKKASVSMLA